jgi:hypothetical protein
MRWQFKDTALYALFANCVGFDYIIIGGMLGLYVVLIILALTSDNSDVAPK